ncbi:helix-turn-helix domain containing protein [Mycobacteroides abscessus]|uniref:helix-turn-helix domain containing protein n=1 Tax=Mycobacteroides abscessus TaxID=36809 RepID=UPI00092CA5E3|nr:helix-turn-helix domain containing protein [Mycobacteroides abscessus]SID80767.1 Uncharacterised protein [Mycobacteroides abscessus subsp. abscessus]SKG11703.1 Uncharacterised protein [Mycobacteroides abscessus subsp. massiliense]SKG93880.1 Uncharacterised protein [Mycobacteroides abscessus subsp. massiliense]SKI00659.1 Uncharacterised protein [Mycobacteroides abscessus subsp. massiliense]SKI99124.1 Uncharacterised protein [Mycobacteroides abscessus subsp. massiliense]
MSEIAVVDEHEVEVLKTITLAEAEQMAAEIRELAAVARDGFEKLTHAVKEAKATNIHQVLGYRSWPEFIEAQFGGKIEVHGAARLEVMAFLAGEGMGVRSIAAITDSSKSTVSRVLNQVSQNGTGESEGAQAVTEEKITYGRDDKKYRKPKPRKKPEPKPVDEKPAEVDDAPKRKVQVQSAVRAITKSLGAPVRELVELTYDPRWPKAVLRLTRDDAMDIVYRATQLSLVAEAITSALGEDSPAEPPPAAEEITVEDPETTVLQQDSDAPKLTKEQVKSMMCERCSVILPSASTGGLCDDCDGVPESPVRTKDNAEPPAVVVHNETISKRSHERRRFGVRKVSA